MSSCRAYLDDKKYLPINNDTFKIYVFKDYNEFNYHSKIGVSADKDFFYPQHFNIHIPKKIKNWSASNKVNFIEYNKNKLIIIDAGHIDKEIQIIPWKRIEDKRIVSNYISSYYELRKKYFDYDKKINLRNINLYTDGKTYILFYKIENSEIFNFEKIISSFSYIN